MRPMIALVAAGAALWLATPDRAPAQPAPATIPPAAPSSSPLVGGGDFISPMGQPVHSADALSGAEHWFAAADADHDGRLTLAEFRADGLRFFATLDINHDGEIDPAEIERYETVVAPEIQVTTTAADFAASSGDGSDADKPPPYPDRMGAGRYGYIDLPEPLLPMDQNFDRGISQAEFLHAADQRFRQLDLNHDGGVARDELPKLSATGGGDGRRRHRRR